LLPEYVVLDDGVSTYTVPPLALMIVLRMFVSAAWPMSVVFG
jgi:hypothetical protein